MGSVNFLTKGTKLKRSTFYETPCMLTKSGFAAAIKSSNEHHIQLFTNDKIVEVAKSVNFDVSEKKEYTETYYYYNVIEKRTEEMRVQY